MEAEYSDLFDRKLMSLYGLKDAAPTRLDQAGTETKAYIEQEQKGLNHKLHQNDQSIDYFNDAPT
jgi:hypothetical protein